MSSFDDWIGRTVPDAVMEDAASWMALLDSVNCTRADRMSFAQWLSEDPMHQAAFEELAEIWARLRVLPDLSSLSAETGVIPFPGGLVAPDSVRRAAKPARQWMPLIASLVLVAGIAVHGLFGVPSERHQTAVGEIQSIPLADGSTIELDAASAVDIQFDDQLREVRMAEGTAFFSVAHDARPFTVRTQFATVTAVGTKFQVLAGEQRMRVAVIEGFVSVSSNVTTVALTEFGGGLPMRFHDEVALLGVGQQLEVTRESQRFVTLTDDALADDTSWRNGGIVFEAEPLLGVLTETRRYYKQRILVGDPRLNGLRVSGRFPIDSPARLLSHLETELGLVVDCSAGTHCVLRLPE